MNIILFGPPGAGKTTIAHLIGRYYDVSDGRISIDGQDIRDITLESLRNSVSIVQQEPFLFTASLDHNVAYGAPWASRTDIDHSAQTAQLHNYIRALPDAYDTLVGERGVSLSGGQRQRIGLARALYLNRPILVLDEATSALDIETESEVMKAIDGLAGQKTIIIKS